MADKREITLLEGNAEEVSGLLVYGERHNEWQFVDGDTTDVDLDKGGQEMYAILKRKSDDKLFKFEFYKTNYHSLDDSATGNDWPLRGTEVFPKTKTITTYI